MAKDRSLVRASDIGAWTFCHRAWWLARVQGIPHRNPAQLQHGNAVHLRHGEQTQHAHAVHQFGRVLIALGLLVLLVSMAWIILAH